VAADRRTRTIGGEFKRRQASETLPPVTKSLWIRNSLSLPASDIGLPQRSDTERCTLTPNLGVIEGAKFPADHGQ
jgi:hypothetical protein